MGYRHSITTRKKMSASAKSGKYSPLWRGGVTKVSKSVRECYRYKEWRNQVFKRDNWTCQDCFVRGGVEISPHHIKSFRELLDENNIKSRCEAIKCEELWDVTNGKTLCRKCHLKTDTFGGKNKKSPNIPHGDLIGISTESH